MNYKNISKKVFETFNMGGFYRCLLFNGVFYINTVSIIETSIFILV